MTDYKRFERQTILPNFGLIEQQKLLEAKVLVIGAGGLGCPALLYLAAAGIGTLGIIDFDVVSISNLNRQVLFGATDVGMPKASCAAVKLKNLYPDLHCLPFNKKLKARLCRDLFDHFDVIVDASDNFATRYLVNDACVLLGKPLVYGAVFRYEGQVGVFNFPNNEAANYRDAYPEMPGAGEVPSCAEAGVLGILPGVIGTMQAGEVIKIISGVGEPLQNKILSYTYLQNSFYEIQVLPNEAARRKAPKNLKELEAMNYEHICGAITPHQP
jgi:adenylyltransferase/sulfurtransferase